MVKKTLLREQLETSKNKKDESDDYDDEESNDDLFGADNGDDRAFDEFGLEADDDDSDATEMVTKKDAQKSFDAFTKSSAKTANKKIKKVKGKGNFMAGQDLFSTSLDVNELQEFE